ncbi:MAG: glycosyltransferase family 2 protein [Cloacibacterium sp.]
MLVTASIVLYNNDVKVLSDAIKSFLNSNFPYKKHLYLIDNSPNETLKQLVSISPENITYIFNPTNPGFGAAHNIAIKKAIEGGSKYHLVLNPDVYFENTTIDLLLKFMNDQPNVGNVMPKVFYPDGNLQYLCKFLPTPYDWIGRRFNPFKKMVDKRNDYFEMRFTGYDKVMDVPYLSGCFMFLRVDALKKIGFFDEGIFMYGEETDLCRRLIDGGYRTVFYPNATIYHHFEKGSHKSFRLTKIGIQSAIYYFNKWGWFFDKRRKEINTEALKKIRGND